MTDPVFSLLHRTQAVFDAKELIAATSTLLQELVNYSTGVYKRCQHAGNTSDEDLPSFILLLHILEMTDGIEVLLSQSCCESAVPLIRSSFEAFISLQYLFQEQEKDYRRRCLCWLYCDHLERKRAEKQLDRESGQGKQLAQALNAEQPNIHLPTLSPEQLKHIRSPRKDPRFVPIIKEYERLKKEERIGRPPWYRMYKGPGDLQQLARKVKMENLYLTFYRDWSAVAHGGSSRRYIERRSNGTLVQHQLRFPENLVRHASWAGKFILTATDSMIRKFRLSERNHFKWSADIAKRLQEMSDIEVVIKTVRL